MSDRDRIDRLQKTRPEDLSPAEVEELRKRAGRSKEVRKAVADEVRLDQALYTTMGNPPLSTADVVANAKRGSSSPRRRGVLGGFLATVFGWLLALVLTTSLAAGTVALLSQLRPTVVPQDTPSTTFDLVIDSHHDDASPSDVMPHLAPKEGARKKGSGDGGKSPAVQSPAASSRPNGRPPANAGPSPKTAPSAKTSPSGKK